MSNPPSLNSQEILRWFEDRGDYTHNINYDLNENSLIMDLGGYTGIWAQQMIDKYSPYVFIIEPVPNFYNSMVYKFKDNEKVKLLNVGIATENKEGEIFLNGDASSSISNSGQKINITFLTIEEIFKKFNLQKIDLLQINIEGDEYLLLENMLQSGFINNFKNLQIQFHMGIDNFSLRREKIQEGLLLNNFKNKFNYPFVWESWAKE